MIESADGKSRELGYRMQLAEQYPTLAKLGTIVPTLKTWTAFCELRRDWSVRRELIGYVACLSSETIASVRLLMRVLMAICFGTQHRCNLALDTMILREGDR